MNYANRFTATREAGFSKGVAYLDEDLCYILVASLHLKVPLSGV